MLRPVAHRQSSPERRGSWYVDQNSSSRNSQSSTGQHQEAVCPRSLRSSSEVERMRRLSGDTNPKLIERLRQQDQASRIMVGMASQERRVMELREELARAEHDLKRLRKKWVKYEAVKHRPSIEGLFKPGNESGRKPPRDPGDSLFGVDDSSIKSPVEFSIFHDGDRSTVPHEEIDLIAFSPHRKNDEIRSEEKPLGSPLPSRPRFTHRPLSLSRSSSANNTPRAELDPLELFNKKVASFDYQWLWLNSRKKAGEIITNAERTFDRLVEQATTEMSNERNQGY